MKNTPNILKKAVLTAAAVFLLTTPSFAADFTDAASLTHLEAAAALADLGIINGRSDGSFDPDGLTRRSEMAKMLSRLVEPNTEGNSLSSGFPDVLGTWAEPYIDHCYSLGLIGGYADGNFHPNETITGTAAAKMLLAAVGYDTSGFTGEGWSQRVGAAAEAAGLYDGFDADPAAPLTRDGAAVLLYNGLKLLTREVLNAGGALNGIALLPDGSMLLTDIRFRTVYQLKDGELNVFAGAVTDAVDVNGQPLGGYYDGSIEESTFQLPWAAAPFLDGWAVSDAENNVVRLIKDGQVQTINPRAGMMDRRALAYPTGLAAGPDGSLYVSDTHNGLIRKISPDGVMTTVAQRLRDPTGLCWHDGALYIAETGANRILRLQDGVVTAAAGSGEAGYADGKAASAAFSGPRGVAVGEDGSIFVSDTGNSAIRRIQNGQVTTEAIRDVADEADHLLVSPAGLAILGNQLYICDAFTGSLLTRVVS